MYGETAQCTYICVHFLSVLHHSKTTMPILLPEWIQVVKLAINSHTSSDLSCNV